MNIARASEALYLTHGRWPEDKEQLLDFSMQSDIELDLSAFDPLSFEVLEGGNLQIEFVMDYGDGSVELDVSGKWVMQIPEGDGEGI